MASHSHLHRQQCGHHFGPQTTTNSSSCCCLCCCCTIYPQSHHHPHAPISPHAHIYSPHYTLHPHYRSQCYPYPPPPEPHRQKQPHPYPYLGRRQDEYDQQQQQEEPPRPVVPSLLRRISALESSILLLLRRRRHYSPASHSLLHDAAACIIQTHFRAFLVRRSQALRRLKHLSFIKSTLNSLKSSVSDKTHVDSQTLSRKATALLLKLDSIQGGDPMIRDGKKSICGELVRFIESLERASAKSDGFDFSVRNLRSNGNCEKSKRVLHSSGQRKLSGQFACRERELRRALVGKVNGISGLLAADDEQDDRELQNHNRVSMNAKFEPSSSSRGGLIKGRAKKSVRFAEEGNVYGTIRRRSELMSNGFDGGDSLDYDGVESKAELLEYICGQVEEIGISSKENEEDGQFQSEDEGGSLQISEGEIDPKTDVMVIEGNGETMRRDQSEGERVSFSAPAPVKMETRSDLINKRSTVKMVA